MGVLERSIPDGRVTTAVETISDRVGPGGSLRFEPTIEETVDQPFDAFLRKAVIRTDLLDAIERLLLRRSYIRSLERYFSIQTKLDLIESALRPNELAQLDEHAALSAADELRRQVEGRLTELNGCSPG